MTGLISQRRGGEDSCPLASLITSMDPLTVEIVTHGWESCPPQEISRQWENLGVMWGAFGDGGGLLRATLLSKKKGFASGAMAGVVRRVMGFGPADESGAAPLC